MKKHDEKSKSEIFFQPLKDIHLRSDFAGDLDNYKKGEIRQVYIYCIIALSILVIACFNFINLSIARSYRRAKEVGLRKVMGTGNINLLYQFLGESVLYSFIALLIAITLVIMILPVFSTFVNRELSINFLADTLMITVIAGFTGICGILAGSCPAFYLSHLKPAKIL